MAKVVKSQQQVVVEPWWAKIKIVYSGLGIGVVWWVLTALLNHYVIEPLACRDLSSATVCVNSFSVAGSIATVLAAIAGAYVLVRLLQPRPIIIAVAAAVLLWNLGAYLNGLSWWEALGWAVVLYGLAYVLFSLVVRVKNTLAAIILTAAILIAILLVLLV